MARDRASEPLRSELVAARRSHLVWMEPAELAPGEVALDVLVCGVCASDLPEWDAPPTLPWRLGHEPVGVVTKVGPATTGIRVGETVTGRAEPGFADTMVARAADLVSVPARLQPEQVIGEPIGCVVHALGRTRILPGDRVAIVGAGFMGLVLLNLLAGSRAIATVDVLDPRQDAREAALRSGASHALPPLANDGASTYQVVFEVSGTQPGLDLASALLADHGRLCIVGYHQGTRTVDMKQWNEKALDVVNGHVRDPSQLVVATRQGLQLVADGRLDIRPLITHTFALDEVDLAYETLASKPIGFVKAIVDLRLPIRVQGKEARQDPRD